MKRLLRGVIDFGDSRITDENINVNYQRLSRSEIEWNNPDERKLFTFIKEYVQKNHETPSASVIRDFFERLNELTVTEKLLDVGAVEVYVRTHYETLLTELVEEQRGSKIAKIAQEAGEIATKGIVVGTAKAKRRMQGAEEAVKHFMEKAPCILHREGAAKTEGDLRLDTESAWSDYESAKGGKAYGKFWGVEPIDTVCHGVKRSELWVHAGFAGHLKTSVAANWAYNTVTRYLGNVLYVSLEMPYRQLQRMIYTLHSANGAFRAEGNAPLNYRSVRDGELSLDQEAFLRKTLKDFESNKRYCRFHVWTPDRAVTIKDIRAYAERMHREWEVSMLIIDHAGLVSPSEKDPNHGVRMNSVFRDAKLLALHFAKGEGVPVVLLHQLSREGLKEADKNGGRYGLHALSWAHEAERSADVVTTSYLNDELRAQEETIVCNLKNRENPLFDPVRLSIDWGCRRIFWDPEGAGISLDAPEVEYDIDSI